MPPRPGTRPAPLRLPAIGGGESEPELPALVAFVKSDCPVSALVAPYLERLHRAGAPVAVVAQDPAEDARAFAAASGLTLPVLLDLPPFAAGEAWELEYVPTLVRLDAAGVVRQVEIGFRRAGIEAMAAALADETGRGLRTPFLPDDDVPELRPG